MLDQPVHDRILIDLGIDILHIIIQSEIVDDPVPAEVRINYKRLSFLSCSYNMASHYTNPSSIDALPSEYLAAVQCIIQVEIFSFNYSPQMICLDTGLLYFNTINHFIYIEYIVFIISIYLRHNHLSIIF